MSLLGSGTVDGATYEVHGNPTTPEFATISVYRDSNGRREQRTTQVGDMKIEDIARQLASELPKA